MRKVMAGVAVACLLSGIVPALGQVQFQNPPPPGTITFDKTSPFSASQPLNSDLRLFKAPVKSPTGSTVARFLRVEMHDGETPVGIVNVTDANRTIAVPLERLRFNPAGGEVFTDMSWHEINSISPGIREKSSRWYPFGRPPPG